MERVGLGLNIDFSKQWRFSLLTQASFQDKFTNNSFFMEARLRFRPIKGLTIQPVFRYSPAFDEFDQSKIMLEVIYNLYTSNKAWSFNNRIRLEYIPVNKNAPEGFEPLNLFRYRARARWFLSKKNYASLSFEPVIDWANLNQLFFYEIVFDFRFPIKTLAVKPYVQYRKYIEINKYDFVYRIGSNFMLPIKFNRKKANKGLNTRYGLFLRLNIFYYRATRI